MAFWGIEVKPGKPYTHKSDDSNGRLHISMATLALGTATAKSVLQCNVGNRSPVYLCALYPVSSESLQLNLEFEEADDVVFSVIGPRSVFLTGYYLRGAGQELEPCGEDIVDTETERSEDSDEDEYEDSFINDDDLEVYPPSPVSDGGEILDNEKPKNRKDSRIRLRKKYQICESDDEGCSQQKDTVKGSSSELALQSEDDDSVPISYLYKSKTTANKTTEEVEGNTNKETCETSNKKTEDGNYVIEPTRTADNVVSGQPKITIEKTTEEIEGKTDKGTGETSDQKAEDDGNYAIQPKRKAHDVFIDGQSKTTMKERTEEVDGRADKGTGETSYKRTEELELSDTVMLPSTEVGCEDGERPKKKRKEREKEERTCEAESKHYNFVKEDKAQQNESNAENRVQDFPLRDKAANDNREAELLDKFFLPSTKVGSEDGEKPKKKRKERLKEGKAFGKDSNIVKEDKVQQDEVKANNMILGSLEVELPENPLLPSTKIGSEVGEKLKKKSKQQARDVKISKTDSKHNNGVREDRAQQNEAKANDIVQGLPMTDEQNQNLANDKSFDSNVREFDDENHSKEKNIKKKKKSRTQENVEAVNKNISLLSVDKIENKEVNDKSSQVQTLSNGLMIEVLEMGKPDGKVAAFGKKISINYNGKLKENGESFDSNVGAAPYKFRLGVGKVIEGWDIGLDGMRVGEKRRLIIPPSMGFGSEGCGENVPPDSWLEYDVELVKVH
ncbi:peptidyl-prolyl cis-trans isomerase FKBP43-like isoform X3 [Alnus glutinosa]|uniref:peptidyl-prolyl cis-trans isomerase FKBP43-like isoform X3 n=1 Tax=Alnus glutinosa TaxID=3517 RepID=UPI002D77AE2F|nr:peptidyl-prolyl cis-trans isomerase FKBP43-like isoform X3 [Alnus glutinosa]